MNIPVSTLKSSLFMKSTEVTVITERERSIIMVKGPFTEPIPV